MPAKATPPATDDQDPVGTEPRARWIALIGNPNTGKTTLFNALTGVRALTGNYAGVTVDKIVGTLRGTTGPGKVQVLDLPGTYSLSARSPDEIVAVDVLLGRRADTPQPGAVVVVVDATNLERNFYIVTQIMELGLPTIVALNMMDTAAGRGITVDVAALSDALGVPVIGTIGHRGEGIDELRAAVLVALDAEPPASSLPWPPAVQEADAHLVARLAESGVDPMGPAGRRRALFDIGGEAERRLVAEGGEEARSAVADSRRILEEAGSSPAGLEASVRYAFIQQVMRRGVNRPHETPSTLSDRIDVVLTHRVFGTAVLVAVMGAMFLSIFAWAAPLMDLVDGGIFGTLRETARGWAWLGDGAFQSLVVDGVIAGVGSVLIFLPQILILFGLIAILEGCGYMSRAAFLADRLMRRLGLSGRSFIPLISSFACAVPGILAARTIEDRRERIVTILAAPFMSCAARIPVYVILVAAFVPVTMVLGFLPLQGLVFAGMYFVGIVVGVATAFLLKRTALKSGRPSFLVELPPYRIPHPGVVLRRMYEQGLAFVTRAGTVIFAATILIWALSYFPRHPDAGAEARAAVAGERERLEVERARQEQAVARAEGESAFLGEKAREGYARYLAWLDERRAELDAQVDHAAAADGLEYSILGRGGKAVQPVFEPMGWDWKVSVAVLSSFPAREVFVSSLGVLYGLGSDVDAESEGLRDRLRSATWDSGPRVGQPVLGLPGAIGLMIFFALCAQCVSTLVTIRKETGAWRWTAFSFVYMTALAWVGAFLAVTVLRGILGS